jgi:hypothetical protein
VIQIISNSIVWIVCVVFFLVMFITKLTTPTPEQKISLSTAINSKPEQASVTPEIEPQPEEGEEEFNAYKIKRYRQKNDEGFKYEIRHKGKLIKTGTSFSTPVFTGQRKHEANYAEIKTGDNITGNGIPNLVVSTFTGGAHCCSQFEVFELGKDFKRIALFDVADAGNSHFEKRGDDKRLVFVTNDFTFAYWNTSFADSPAPEVILRYCNGKYRLADDLMRKQSIDEKRQQDLIKKIADLSKSVEPSTSPTPLLWETMLNLIYSGNEKTAWEFFEKAWPTDLPDKRQFARDFRNRLTKSLYWREVRMMNEGKKICQESH